MLHGYVRGDNVIIEEYNWYINGVDDHSYYTQTLPISHYTGYIHFKDLKSGNTSIPDAPTLRHQQIILVVA